MTRHIQVIPRPTRDPDPAPAIVNTPNRILYCEICETYTAHALTKSQDAYVCGICAAEITYHVNAAKECTAINLQESPDAAERFAAWCDEMKGQ